MSDAENDGEPEGGKALDALHTAADTVGMVPNVRLKDNLVQGAVVLGGTLVAAVVGLFLGPAGERWIGAAAGAVVGLIVSGLASGLVLMVLGWTRTAKKLGKGRPQ